MEQEVAQSCPKALFPFHCKELEKKIGKTTGNTNRRILIRVGVEKRAEGGETFSCIFYGDGTVFLDNVLVQHLPWR